MEGFKLEPDYEPAFTAWKQQANPATTGALLRSISPVIDKGISVYAGAAAGPTTKSHARRIALQAVRSYDPAQAQLGTHVMNHLKGLRRIVRRQSNAIRVPERVAGDNAALHAASLNLEDELGREPTTAELADRVGLSARRIAKLRQFRPEVAEGYLLSTNESPEHGYAAARGDNTELLARALYDDLHPRDQLILEWSLGLDGKKQLDNQAIAGKLGVTPGAVSQRKAILQQKLKALADTRLF
jgi:DNA-directed RNA polymerase specialized sigma subunit